MVERVGGQPHRRRRRVRWPARADLPRAPPRPAARRAASSTCRCAAAAFRSRTPSPPLRSAPGGVVPQWSRSSSTRRTASKAAPAAVRSTRSPPRGVVASAGGRRPARAWYGRRAAPGPPGRGWRRARAARGTSRRAASSSSTGVAGVRRGARRGVRCRPIRPGRRRARASRGPGPTRPRSGAVPRRGSRSGSSGVQPAHAGRRTPGEALGNTGQRPQRRAVRPARLPGDREVDEPRGRRLDGRPVGVHQVGQLVEGGLARQRRGHQGQ